MDCDSDALSATDWVAAVPYRPTIRRRCEDTVWNVWESKIMFNQNMCWILHHCWNSVPRRESVQLWQICCSKRQSEVWSKEFGKTFFRWLTLLKSAFLTTNSKCSIYNNACGQYLTVNLVYWYDSIAYLWVDQLQELISFYANNVVFILTHSFLPSFVDCV